VQSTSHETERAAESRHNISDHHEADPTPTPPHDAIMPMREIAAEAARPLSRPASALLREIVGNGTWVLARCAASCSGEVDVDLAALNSYRTIIEMADGIDVSIRESSVTPAVPQLRTLFEASLQLRYILEDPAKYRERSLAWFAAEAIARLRRYRRYDKSSPAGREYLADKAADETGSHVRDPDQEEVARSIADMESVLTMPHVLPFKLKHDTLASAGIRLRFWCQLCDGPRTRRDLARHLKLSLTYSELYTDWSGVSHATDTHASFMHVPGKGGVIRPLRDHGRLLRVATVAASFALSSTRRMLEHFRQGEDSYSRWYAEKVRPNYLSVAGMSEPREP
jgi:Family of unknown function (DUF5677)